MKTVCIYRNVDLDGWMSASMSAAIVKYWWENAPNAIDNNNDKLDFIGYNYSDPIPDLLGYDRVIMSDISFPKEEMNKLHWRLRDNFIWNDHHISAIKDSLDYSYQKSEGLRLTSFAACELTWKYFFPNEPMPEIVRLLGMYDCFRHKGTNEEQIVLYVQYGARSVISNYQEAYEWLKASIEKKKVFGYELDNCSLVETRKQLPEDYLLNIGSMIYRYLKTEARQIYRKSGFPVELDYSKTRAKGPSEVKTSFKFICVNRERFNPIDFGINYHEDGYDGAACFWYQGGEWQFSLYNDNGKVDCSIIAKQFGGGGHQDAAGFRTPDLEGFLLHTIV